MVGTTGIDCELPWNPKFSNIADIQLEGKLANRQIVVPIRKKEIPTAGLTCLVIMMFVGCSLKITIKITAGNYMLNILTEPFNR